MRWATARRSTFLPPTLPHDDVGPDGLPVGCSLKGRQRLPAAEPRPARRGVAAPAERDAPMGVAGAMDEEMQLQLALAERTRPAVAAGTPPPLGPRPPLPPPPPLRYPRRHRSGRESDEDDESADAGGARARSAERGGMSMTRVCARVRGLCPTLARHTCLMLFSYFLVGRYSCCPDCEAVASPDACPWAGGWVTHESSGPYA